MIKSISDDFLTIGLRAWIAEFSGEGARCCYDLVAHQRDMLVARTHGGSGGADSTDHRAGLVADGSTNANDAGQKFLTVDGIAVATDDTKRFDQCREFRDGVVREALHAVGKNAPHFVLWKPSQNRFANRCG